MLVHQRVTSFSVRRCVSVFQSSSAASSTSVAKILRTVNRGFGGTIVWEMQFLNADHAASIVPVWQTSLSLPRYPFRMNSPRWWLTYSCKMPNSLLKITTNVVASCVTRVDNIVASCVIKVNNAAGNSSRRWHVVANCVKRVDNVVAICVTRVDEVVRLWKRR